MEPATNTDRARDVRDFTRRARLLAEDDPKGLELCEELARDSELCAAFGFAHARARGVDNRDVWTCVQQRAKRLRDEGPADDPAQGIALATLATLATPAQWIDRSGAAATGYDLPPRALLSPDLARGAGALAIVVRSSTADPYLVTFTRLRELRRVLAPLPGVTARIHDHAHGLRLALRWREGRGGLDLVSAILLSTQTGHVLTDLESRRVRVVTL